MVHRPLYVTDILNNPATVKLIKISHSLLWMTSSEQTQTPNYGLFTGNWRLIFKHPVNTPSLYVTSQCHVCVSQWIIITGMDLDFLCTLKLYLIYVCVGVTFINSKGFHWHHRWNVWYDWVTTAVLQFPQCYRPVYEKISRLAHTLRRQNSVQDLASKYIYSG